MRLFPTIFLVVFLVTATASAQAPLLSAVAPSDDLAFVEIHNLGDATLDLTGYHLASNPEFYRVAEDSLGDGPDGWVIAFPDGFVLPAGRAVVLLSGTVDDFVATHGFAPEAVVGEPSMGAVAMDVVHGTPASPAAAADLVALFVWDGASDLVQDADLVFWGDGPRVDRNGVVVDGPDDGLESTPYPAETAAMVQTAAAAPADGEALVRVGAEGEEDAGGIGIDGFDETSEDLSASFGSAAAAPLAGVTIVGTVTADVELAGDLVFSTTDAEDVVVALADQGFAVELTPDTEFTVTVTTDDGVFAGVYPAGNASDRAVEIALTLEATFSIAGVVSADAAAPADLTMVSLVVEESGQAVPFGDDGVFSVEVADPGTYTLLATGPDVRETRVTVEVEAGGVEGVSVVVAAAHTLSGTITGSDTDAAIAGATVTVGAEQFATDAAGAFSAPALAPGVYAVRVAAIGYENHDTEIELNSSQTLDVALAPIARYTMTVHVEAAGAGELAGAKVSVRGGELTVPAEMSTGADGAALFGDIRAGNYTVAVSAPGFVAQSIETIPVRGDTEIVVSLVSDMREPNVRTGTKCACSTPHAPATPWQGLAAFALLGLAVVFRVRGRG
jgi:hypothetical protein